VDEQMTIENSVEDWELIAQVCQVYRSLSDSLMAQIDMHRAQATLLCRLFIQNGMTQSEIGEQLAIQGATVTNIVQRLEEAGLVIRQRDPEDNRLVRVYLTEAGRERERSIVAQFTRLEEGVFKGISEVERALLRRMLQQMLHNMNTLS
jgi:MarR family transcriptional regulator, organic hydroperoxide resistance regulator